ncbi:MAG: DUF1499 domain-containing protein [Parvularculaceae bacterium]
MRITIILVSLAALALAGAILVAGPGTRFGLWEYGTGLTILGKVARPIQIVGPISLSPLFTALGLSALGFVAALFTRRGGLAVLALAATAAAGVAGYAPIKMKQLVEANPFIHDITTDIENPPAIIAGAGFERKNPPDYVGDQEVRDTGMTVAQSQREAFPDIEPLIVEAGLEDTADAAREVVMAMGMEILADAATETGWRIEAVETSFWFGFKDDFIVRLTPEGDGETRVDVRSKSRVGGSDLGANARRVRAFFSKLPGAL